MSELEIIRETKDGPCVILRPTGKSVLQRVSRSAMTVAVCASLVLGSLGLASSAEARVNGPRLDSLSAGCGQLQDESDALRAEYKDSNTTNARRDEILARLRVIGGHWNDVCRGTFGDMAYFVKVIATSDITTVGTLEQAPTSSDVSAGPIVGKLSTGGRLSRR
jgi:hypothetical protein